MVSLDRIVMGQHANTSTGAGLYVSVPGANVMHPTHAQFSNLMFDSNAPKSSLSIIQSGTFKITCSRQAISPLGRTVGADFPTVEGSETSVWINAGSMLVTTAQAFSLPAGKIHGFAEDTGRPAGFTTIPEYTTFQNEDVGGWGGISGLSSMSPGTSRPSKQGNYLDTGSHTIAIENPSPSGAIPKIALRFAVGNSSGHFHPWYANTVATGNKGDWSDIDYASGNTQQIVHMDSNWMRLKWGGLGAEAYSGLQESLDPSKLIDFFRPSQVPEYWRQEYDQTAQNSRFGNSYGANPDLENNIYRPHTSSIEPEGQDEVNFPPRVGNLGIADGPAGWPDPPPGPAGTPETGTWTPATPESIFMWHYGYYDADFIPGGNPNFVEQGAVTKDDIIKKLSPEMKKMSLALSNAQGVVGLIPYVNSTSIHVDAYMSPTHAGIRQPIDRTYNKIDRAQRGMGYNAIDDYASINFPFEHHPHTRGLHPSTQGALAAPKTFSELPGIAPGPGEVGYGHYGAFDSAWMASSMMGYERDEGKRDMYGWGGHPTEFFVNPFSNGNCTFYTHMQPPYFTDRIYGTNTAGSETTSNFGTYHQAWVGRYIPTSFDGEKVIHGTPGEHAWQLPYHTAWGPLINKQRLDSNDVAINATSNEVIWNQFDEGASWGFPWGFWDMANTKFSGTGIHWPPGHEFADYFDHRDWVGSMGLDGAGSKESLAKEDCWDTFYCSYVVYSETNNIIPKDAQNLNVIPIDVRVRKPANQPDYFDGGRGDLHATEKYRFNQNGTEKYYFNLNFPDDFVGTIGDPDTDPFWQHRDYSEPNKRIYGNVVIKLRIPKGHTEFNGNQVVLVSDTMTYETIDIGGITWRTGYGTPDPVISFDLSETKFQFENNTSLSLIIENYAIILGGGGSGGRGTKGISIFTEQQTLPVYGGGGGGAGGGSGVNFPAAPEETIFGEYRGVGRAGSGWARGGGGSLTFGDVDNILDTQKGTNGTDLPYVWTDDYQTRNESKEQRELLLSEKGLGGLGAVAEIPLPDSTFISSSEPEVGGDGGSVFDFKLSNLFSDKVQIDIINKDDIVDTGAPDGPGGLESGPYPERGGVIASGGGGGGGGSGTPGIVNTPAENHTAGADGAPAGTHGNAIQGSPSSFAASSISERSVFPGGAAGYLATGALPGTIRVINESIYPIKARGRTETTFTPGSVGFQVDWRSTKKY
jgi:hypothetical protein